MSSVLTVKGLEEVGRPGRESDYRVVLWDDDFPSQEVEFLLREGAAWARGSILEVASFTVRERASSEERINASLIKTVPFGRWVAVAVGAAGDFREGRNTEVWTCADPESLRPRRRPQRRGTTLDNAGPSGPDYEAVALIYRIGLRTGAKGTAEDVAAAFGVAPSLAAHWISRTRYMGLLGPIAPRNTPLVEGRGHIVPAHRNRGPR